MQASGKEFNNILEEGIITVNLSKDDNTLKPYLSAYYL